MSLYNACRKIVTSDVKCDIDCIWSGARKRTAPREDTGEAAQKKRRRSFTISSTADRVEELAAARDEADDKRCRGCIWILSSCKAGFAKQVYLKNKNIGLLKTLPRRRDLVLAAQMERRLQVSMHICIVL